jgi:metal-responsive CopG/Arc/MetJ family transcriptional regulator
MARAHVVMSDSVLKAIDRKVGQRSRSRFLEEAAREKLARLELEDSLRQTKGAAKGARYRHWRDSATSHKWVRDGRERDRKA